MGYLTKEQILTADDLPRETVEVPEWGGEVLVKALTGLERHELIEQYAAAQKVNADEPFDIHLVGAAMCGENGDPLLDTLDEIRLLGRRNGAALERVFRAAQRLNGFDRAAQKKG